MKSLEEKKEYQRKWRLENKQKISDYQKKWRLENNTYCKNYTIENKIKINDRSKKWALSNKDKVAEYYIENKEKLSLMNKIYASNNKEKRNKQSIVRRNSEPLYKLTCYYRNRVSAAITAKSWKKNNRHKEILCCDYQTIKEHFESRFTIGMNWGNHGEWHIDHIIPCSSAKNEFDLIKLFHYENLQPLWAKDNYIKGKSIL